MDRRHRTTVLRTCFTAGEARSSLSYEVSHPPVEVPEMAADIAVVFDVVAGVMDSKQGVQ